MKTKDEALKMAIEALKRDPSNGALLAMLCQALKQPEPRMFLDLSNSNGNHPIEQPAQEPVTDNIIIDGLKYPAKVEVMTIYDDAGIQTEDNCDCINAFLPQGTPLYTHPAPSWQGLSDTEYMVLASNFTDDKNMVVDEIGFARAIEQALKEKNEK